MDELDRIRLLSGITASKPATAANISHTGTEKARIQRERGIKPGTPEWFHLWFSLPYLTGKSGTEGIENTHSEEDSAMKINEINNSCDRTRAKACQCDRIMSLQEDSAATVIAQCILEQSDDVTGTILLMQSVEGGTTLIKGTIRGLAPGLHGLHIHEFGDLSQGCKSAGGHYNPDGVAHGDADDGHVGDLGNITADSSGISVFTIKSQRIDLIGERSVVGRSFVVHGAADDLGKGGDEESLKTGNSGDRLACGVITLRSTDVTEDAAADMDPSKKHQAVPQLKAALLSRKLELQQSTDSEVYDLIDSIMTRIARANNLTGQELHDMWVEQYTEVPDTWIMHENFADGKNPQRKGLAARSGVDTKASVSSLRKTAKNSTGEKQRMAHWLANMKSGKEKKQ
jgi:Cu-Zn family superoxide dismutase